MRKLLTAVLTVLLAASAWGQGPPSVTASSLELPLQVNTPPVSSAQISTVGNPGNSTFYYWVVANYLIGPSSPAGPFIALRAPNSLSGSNYVKITPAISGEMLSVDVLRTTSAIPPSGACNCAVATAQTGTVNDQSNSLSSYTVAPVNIAALQLSLRNVPISAGVSHPIIYQGGSLLVDLAASGSGTITAVNPGAGITGGGASGAVTVALGACPLGQTQISNGAGYACGNAGSALTTQTNGVNNASQAALNLLNSAATNGITLTATNTTGGNVQLGFTGTASNAFLANSTITINTTSPLGGGASPALGSSITLTCSTCATVGTASGGQIAQFTSGTAVQGINATGSGNAVLATGPTITSANLVTPSLGVATATSINGGTPVTSVTAASGDLGGTYPGPTVTNVGNVTSGILYLGGLNNGAPAAGQVPFVASGATFLNWLAPGTAGCMFDIASGSGLPQYDTNVCFSSSNLTVNGTVTGVSFIGTGPWGVFSVLPSVLPSPIASNSYLAFAPAAAGGVLVFSPNGAAFGGPAVFEPGSAGTGSCTNGQQLLKGASAGSWTCSTPAGTPTLNQVGDPTANKTFSMGSHTLAFSYSGQPGSIPGFQLSFNGNGSPSAPNVDIVNTAPTDVMLCVEDNGIGCDSSAYFGVGGQGDRARLASFFHGSAGIEITDNASTPTLQGVAGGIVNANQVNGAAVPLSATVLGTNASRQLVSATVQGNGAKVQLSTGTTTTNDCVKFDANGNTVDAGGACGGAGSGGTVTYTSSQVASTSDSGKLVVMNCGSACSYTLPNPQPSNTFNVRIVTTGSSVATIVLGASMTWFGGGSVPTLNSFRLLPVYADSATATNYVGEAPLTAGSNITFTPSATSFSIASSASVGAALSSLTAATASNSISNGNNPQTWQSQLTTNSTNFLTLSESAAGTATGANILSISTAAGSTVTPLTVANSLSGSQTLSALVIAPTWNTTGVVDAALLVNPTNNASGAASLLADFSASSAQKAVIDKGGDIAIAGANFGGLLATSNITLCGGDALTSCTSSTNGLVGGVIVQGQDDNGTGSAIRAGFAILRGGELTNATPNGAALEGGAQVGMGALKGSAIAAAGDIVCSTTTAFTVTDCSHTGPAATVLGIAMSTTNPIGLVFNGMVPVKLDNTATIGDVVCMGTTTDGQGHDNGTSACGTLSTTIGVVIATSGTFTGMAGSGTGNTTLSTSLPLVVLHILP